MTQRNLQLVTGTAQPVWQLEDYDGHSVTNEIFAKISDAAKNQYGVSSTQACRVAGIAENYGYLLAKPDAKHRNYPPKARQMLDAYKQLGVPIAQLLQKFSSAGTAPISRIAAHITVSCAGVTTEIDLRPGCTLSFKPNAEQGFDISVS